MIQLRRTSFLLPLATVLLIAFESGCTKDKAEAPPELVNENDGDSSQNSACDTLFNSFAQDIDPIFAQNCATSNCHDQSSQQDGIVLETHSQIRDETKNGKVLCAVRHETGCTDMPYLENKLSQKKIDAIECWANDGYPNN